ncbi:serine/threonine-protein kinase [Vibrio atypicus]|uniref:serine/threonine-protein kinase n=1 Tax=Vibrio atypicus TaxID=558271 RepID=UPI003735A985
MEGKNNHSSGKIESNTTKRPEDNTDPNSKEVVSHDKTVIQTVGSKNETKGKTAQHQSLIGKIVKDRYELEQLIGHGGMCDVYRAKDLILEQTGDKQPYVAIKFLQSEFHDQPDAINVLIREARKTQQLSHHNIIRVYDYGHEHSGCYLVMEWLDGQTLDEVIKRHRPNGVPYKKAMAVLNQLTDALSYAHQNGVVHADLKPGNVMLARDGSIKIFDFGVSRALNLNIDKYAAEKPDATSSITGFTPTYATPELLQGNSPTISDDVFAFSCIAYELLCSKHPYNRKTSAQALKEQLKPVKPRHLSFAHWHTLKQGLSLNKNNRPSDIVFLTKGLNKSIFKPAAAILLTLGVSVAVAQNYISVTNELKQTRQHVTQLQTQRSADTQLFNSSLSEFLPALGTHSNSQQIPTQAWLRKNQPQLVQYYEKEIDKLLNAQATTYPDYYAIQDVLQEAFRIYPDSYTLSLAAENINQRWSGTIEALSQQIEVHLLQSQYQRDPEGNDIYTLYKELLEVRRNYQLTPNEKAEQVFSASFDDAMEKLDVVELASLIEAGELLFKHSEAQQKRLQIAIEMKNAIQAMAHYQKMLEDGGSPEFPYQAANIVYKPRFDALDKRAKNMLKVVSLDKFALEVDKLSEQVPNDFDLLIDLKQTMANKYLRFSEILLKKRKTRTANKTMIKAQELLSEIQQATLNGA